MKIIKILGGLGNQMFQYAFYLAIKKIHPEEEVYVDISNFNGYNLHNGFELKRVFDIDVNQAPFCRLRKVTIPTYNYKLFLFLKHSIGLRKSHYLEAANHKLDLEVMKIDKDCYYDGYWQNEKYFSNVHDEILRVFKFDSNLNDDNLRVLEMMNSSDSVSIHVRRGDYLKEPIWSGICDLEYYRKAISYIKKKVENPKFFIFSNDFDWCKENLQTIIGVDSLYYVDFNTGNESHLDIMLMKNCKHNIVANSSFSWWGAYLNENKGQIVVSPSRWNRIIEYEDSPIIDSWVKL